MSGSHSPGSEPRMNAPSYTPAPFPRKWVPADAAFKTWDQIEPWYRRLIERPIGSTADLERWLVDCDEVNAAVSEEGERRHIAMTCQTDDPDSRGRASGLRPRHRTPKLKPIQDEIAVEIPQLDPPLRLAQSPLPGFRPGPGESSGALSRGQHLPRDRTGRARPAISEGYRRHERELPRGRSGPPLADGARSSRSPTDRSDTSRLGAGRRPSTGRPRHPRRPLRPDDRA